MITNFAVRTNLTVMDETSDFSDKKLSENKPMDSTLSSVDSPTVESSTRIEDNITTTTNEQQSNKSHRSSQLALQKNFMNNKAILNVGGIRHEVMWRTLARFSNTRLGRLAQIHHSRMLESSSSMSPDELLQLCDDYNLSNDEYFFDRHPHTFLSILNYYRTGKLHLTDNLCAIAFDEDLLYWGIKESCLELCCHNKYSEKKEQLEEEIKRENDLLKDQSQKNIHQYLCCSQVRRNLWDLFEKPQTSIAARIITFISTIFILLSSFTLVLSTIEGFGCILNQTQITDENPRQCDERFLVFVIELICISWFTIEYLIRLYAAPSKSKFFRSFLNTIDLISILPFYFSILLEILYRDKIKDFKSVRKASEILRVLRVMRVLKLARHSTGLQLLGYSLRKSYKELSMLVMFLSIFILLFSSTVYFAEKDVNFEQFQSIPHAFWWAIITMTTVGYGDMYPKSLWGKLIGSLSSICGVLVIALPIPIIVSHFSEYYQEQLRREKLLKKKTDRERANMETSDSNISIHPLNTISIYDHSTSSPKNKASFSIEQQDQDANEKLLY